MSRAASLTALAVHRACLNLQGMKASHGMHL